MVAADTSTWVALLQGDAGEDAQLLDKALLTRDRDFRAFAEAAGLDLVIESKTD
jgi:hypothetical protein